MAPVPEVLSELPAANPQTWSDFVFDDVFVHTMLIKDFHMFRKVFSYDGFLIGRHIDVESLIHQREGLRVAKLLDLSQPLPLQRSIGGSGAGRRGEAKIEFSLTVTVGQLI